MITPQDLAPIAEIEGYSSCFAISTKGVFIPGINFSYKEENARKVLLQFIELKKSLKNADVMQNLQGLTIYGKEYTTLTFFTGKQSKRVLLALTLANTADIERAKFQIYSLFETE